jgi:hypothetical protein
MTQTWSLPNDSLKPSTWQWASRLIGRNQQPFGLQRSFATPRGENNNLKWILKVPETRYFSLLIRYKLPKEANYNTLLRTFGMRKTKLGDLQGRRASSKGG